MLKSNKIFFISGILFFCIFLQSNAQNHLNSPYSRFGMGDLMPRSSIAVTSMGGIGYTFQSTTSINFSNPASYIGFDTLAFLMDAAFSLKTHTLLGGSDRQKGTTMQFDYLAIGLSVRKWWRTAIGIQPYTVMNYTIEESHTLTQGDTLMQNLSYFGEGGINELYWGNAFRLFENFSLGFNASFLFGTYSKNRTIEWQDSVSFNSKIENLNKVRGFSLTLGSQYFIPIKNKGELGIGLVYTPNIPIRSTVTNQISTYWGSDYSVKQIDTLYRQDDTKHSHKMPTIIGAGISWSKKDKYYVGVDFTWENWSKYTIDGNNDSLSDSYKLSFGGCITPNHLSSKYFPRMTFSLGANIEQTRLLLDGKHINKFGINLGMFFPLKRTKTGFGVAFEYGQLGMTKLIKENYFKATLNVRIHERWYQRRKLD